jgi:chemotaxis signal transduction protein
VCLIVDLGDDLHVGLLVDRAVGIERVPPALIFAMPQTMAGVRGYFVLGEGDIVGVIDPPQLVAQVESSLRDAIPRRPSEATDAGAESHGRNRQLLTMRVGSNLYGVTLERIARIEASVHLTPLPDTIDYFDGMADVGDAIVPVLDLRRQQGGAAAAVDTAERPPCILTMIEGAMTGILVDQVLSILDIPPDSFEPVTEASRLPISHVVAFEDRLYSVLTLDRLLPAM